VIDKRHAGVAQKGVSGFAPDQGVVDARIGLAVAQRGAEAAAALECVDELVGEAEHDLARSAGSRSVRQIESAYGPGHAGHRPAATEAITFCEQNRAALSRGGYAGRNTSSASTHDQHVTIEALARPPVHRRFPLRLGVILSVSWSF
jgi:hypothetical protein